VYFEYIWWKFGGRLLDRVNTLKLVSQRQSPKRQVCQVSCAARYPVQSGVSLLERHLPLRGLPAFILQPGDVHQLKWQCPGSYAEWFIWGASDRSFGNVSSRDMWWVSGGCAPSGVQERSPWSGGRKAKSPWSWNTFDFWTFNGYRKFAVFQLLET